MTRIELNQLRIASPCHEDWSAMGGDDRVRHCEQCDRNVYNFSEMTQREIERLIATSGDRICGRMYQRADGTVMTADCPVGRRLARWARTKAAAFALMIGGAVTATAFGATAGREGRTADVLAWARATTLYQRAAAWWNPSPPVAEIMLGDVALGPPPIPAPGNGQGPELMGEIHIPDAPPAPPPGKDIAQN